MRFDICRLSLGEELFQIPVDPNVLQVFFQCMELVNSQPYRYAAGVNIPVPQRFSYAKDYLQMTTEICLLGMYGS